MGPAAGQRLLRKRIIYMYCLTVFWPRTLGYDLRSDRYVKADRESIPRLLQASTELPNQEAEET